MLCEKPLQKIGFRRALLLMKPAHTGHHPGAVPGFRPSPGNSEETTTRVLTEEISVLFRVPTWDPIHPGSPGSRALPGNTPTQGPTREGKPGFFLGGGGNPGRNPGHGLGKTRERGGFRVFPGWYCVLLGVGLTLSRSLSLRSKLVGSWERGCTTRGLLVRYFFPLVELSPFCFPSL